MRERRGKHKPRSGTRAARRRCGEDRDAASASVSPPGYKSERYPLGRTHPSSSSSSQLDRIGRRFSKKEKKTSCSAFGVRFGFVWLGCALWLVVVVVAAGVESSPPIGLCIFFMFRSTGGSLDSAFVRAGRVGADGICVAVWGLVDLFIPRVCRRLPCVRVFFSFCKLQVLCCVPSQHDTSSLPLLLVVTCGKGRLL